MRNIADVTTAVAKGDLSRKITSEAKGEMLELKNTINTMVDQLTRSPSEVTRVAREVGTEGKLGGQAEVPGVAGTWKDLTDNVNCMAANLTDQVRNIADVTTAVAKGDLSQKITVEAKGEILELKNTINTMVDQLNAFAGEVTRVAREVGTEGQARRPGERAGRGRHVEGPDRHRELDGRQPDRARCATSRVVTTAVANGDLSQKITVEAKGEMLELKNTINTMVDQLYAFAAEVTRVAREVGTEGILGGQANVPGVAGTWKDLTDNVNFMAGNLTSQVRNIALVTTAVANGDLSQKITVEAKGEMLELKNTINTMVDQLNAFAAEVTRVAREVGTEGMLGGQANVPGVAGTWKDLTDNVNFMAGNLTGQVRNIADVTTAVANGDLSQKITVEAQGRDARAEEHHQHDGGSAQRVRGEVTRVAREVGTEGRAGRPGATCQGVAGTWRDLTENVNGMAANLTVQLRDMSARHDGDRERRPDAKDHRRSAGRDPRDQGHRQHDGGPAQRVRRRSHARGARGGYRRRARRPGERARRRRHVEGPHRQRERAWRQPDRSGAKHRRRDDRGREGRPVAKDHRRSEGRGARAEEHDQHDGGSALGVRGRSDARGARSGNRRHPRRPGERAGRRAARGRTSPTT